MPTIFTHAVVGYAGARAVAGRRRFPAGILAAATLLPVVPDLDVFLRPWFGYGHLFGHRGFSHSLVFALFAGVLAALACRRDAAVAPGGVGGLALLFAAVTASHGILDALTSGGSGIPFFLPFDQTRYTFPIRPIPASPIGVSAFLSEWGMEVLREEVLLVWPFALAAVAWASAESRSRRVAAYVFVSAGAAAWVWRL